MTSDDDFAAHARWRWIDAWLASKEGHHDEALRAIDAAFVWIEDSDYQYMHADTHRYRGEVLHLAGDEEGARTAFDRAFEFWHRKGTRPPPAHFALGSRDPRSTNRW